jgi:hypothetical protein
LVSDLIVVVSVNLCLFSTKNINFIFGVNLANFKIMYSRFMLAKVKKTKKKHWIESKIVNLLFFFVNGLLWMITIWVLGFRCWLSKLLLNSNLSKYHFVQNLSCLSTCDGFKGWTKYVPTHYVNSICNVLCLIY